MKFSIIVTGYNCEKYVKDCLNSIFNQTYKDFELFTYNDASTDETQSFLDLYLSMVPVIDISYKNSHNMGAIYGRHYLINEVVTGDVVLFVGMDDMLPPNALETLARCYEDPKIKMTYGSWMTPDRVGMIAKPYPSEVFKNKSFRNHKWLATALNSFRTDLIKRVPKEKLINPKTGEFFINCTDLAYSFPCLEMCKEEEVAVVKEITYIYRNDHANTTLNRLGREHKTEVREILRNMEVCE